MSKGIQAGRIINKFFTDSIKRKYGPTLEDARKFYQQAKEKYDLLNNFENQNSALQDQINHLKKELTRAAQKITKQRKKTAKGLEITIEKELSELGIAHVKFEVRIVPVDFDAHGRDKVTFYISPNAGEQLKPLADIVSSGEAARVMLGLKKALINVDPVGVLIFDEIDAQIGGRLGTITGKKLRAISKIRQVILITHLPQIASFADAHFKVTKLVQNGQSITRVDLLDKSSRVEEIAQMMSGHKQSPISIKHARTMLTEAR